MNIRVKVGEEIDDQLAARFDIPSAKGKVSLLEARKEFIEGLAKNWIVLLAGTMFALFFMGAAIIGLIDGSFNELEAVKNTVWSAVMLLIGFAVGQAASKGSGNGKNDD